MKLLPVLILSFFAMTTFASTECYERTYSASHMRANPTQAVKKMRVKIQNEGQIFADLAFKIQGFLYQANTFHDAGFCGYLNQDVLDCELIKGGFTIEKRSGQILLRLTHDTSIMEYPRTVHGVEAELDMNSGNDNFLLYPVSQDKCRPESFLNLN